MFLYICENKRPDRTGENHYTTTSRSNPPTIEELMTHKKKSRLQRKKQQIFVLSGCGLAAFSFRTARRKKKAAANNDTNDNNNNNNDNDTQEAIRTTSAKSLNPGRPRQPQPLNPTYHRAADPRTSYLPTTNQTQLVSE